MATAPGVVWTRLLDGWGSATSIASGSDGAIYIGGYTNSGILDGQVSMGELDAFVVRYDSGGEKKWTKLIGGAGFDSGYSVALGADGVLYAAGLAGSAVFNGQTSSDGNDGFITRFKSDGNRAWSKLIGGNGPDGVLSDHRLPIERKAEA